MNPFSDFLSEQRARFAPDRVVPKPRPVEGFAAENHVHAQDDVIAERNRLGTVIEQRDHRPVNASSFRYPRRALAAPDRQRFTAEIGRQSGLAAEGLGAVCSALRQGAVETLIIGDIGDATVVADERKMFRSLPGVDLVFLVAIGIAGVAACLVIGLR